MPQGSADPGKPGKTINFDQGKLGKIFFAPAFSCYSRKLREFFNKTQVETY